MAPEVKRPEQPGSSQFPGHAGVDVCRKQFIAFFNVRLSYDLDPAITFDLGIHDLYIIVTGVIERSLDLEQSAVGVEMGHVLEVFQHPHPPSVHWV